MDRAIHINDEQLVIPESWVQKDKTDHRLSRRALIILPTAAGEKRFTIVNSLGVNPSVVSKWEKRFVTYGINGLLERFRSGLPLKYN